MQSHLLLLLLLLFCLWPVDCKRRPRQTPRKPPTLRKSWPKTTRSPKSVEDTGCIPTDGTAYTGSANITESGLTCQLWSIDTPDDYDYTDLGEHNFCRDTFDESKAWCYTTDSGTPWEYCDVPLCLAQTQSAEDIGCLPIDGTAYTGSANTTESGLTCQVWSDSVDYHYDFTDVGEHNQCRSPDGAATVWCYTTHPGTLWQYCHVPVCPVYASYTGCLPEDAKSYTGKANTTQSGHDCQMWSVVGYDMEHNYCRSLNGDTKLWCFTPDLIQGWDYCDVPLCMKSKGKGGGRPVWPEVGN